MKGNPHLEQNVLDAINNINKEDLTLESIIEYLDYYDKVRYTEREIINILLCLVKTSYNGQGTNR